MVLEGHGFKHGFSTVLDLFSLSFLMDFHGEAFFELPTAPGRLEYLTWAQSYGSQGSKFAVVTEIRLAVIIW